MSKWKFLWRKLTFFFENDMVEFYVFTIEKVMSCFCLLWRVERLQNIEIVISLYLFQILRRAKIFVGFFANMEFSRGTYERFH